MQTPREPRPSDIFDDIARGTKLEQTLQLIAYKATVDLKAPTCKIWVVKHGDICERCPLAEVCANRQMCLHLITAVGAELDNEYPRIPLAILNPLLVARGGVSDFKGAGDADEKLFGVQQKDYAGRPCSYALYPLKGISGTVGLIGVFSDRLIEADEVQTLAQLAPAAVAAIRVAELQARYDALRHQHEKELAEASSSPTQPAGDEATIKQLQKEFAALQSEYDRLRQMKEDADRRVAALEGENARLREDGVKLGEDKKRLKGVIELLEQRISELSLENDSLRSGLPVPGSPLASLQQTSDAAQTGQPAMLDDASSGGQGELPTTQMQGTEMKEPIALTEATSVRTENDIAELQRQAKLLERQVALLEEMNAELRDNNASLSENLEDLGSTLGVAEDARTRLEQERIKLQEKIEDMTEDMERLLNFHNQMRSETDQLISENERLRSHLAAAEDTAPATKVSELEAKLQDSKRRLNEIAGENRTLTEENVTLKQTASHLEEMALTFKQQQSHLEEEATTLKQKIAQFQEETDRLRQQNADLEGETGALRDANAQLEEAVRHLEEIMPRLEETAVNLRSRTEMSERLCAELEQRHRDLLEENHRLAQKRRAEADRLANLSHEIRTLLNSLVGFTALLTGDASLQLNDQQRHNFDRVAQTSRDLAEFVNKILDYSKIEAGRMSVYSEPVDLRQLISRAISMATGLQTDHRVRVVTEIESGLPMIRTDRTKLQQILLNLLANAVKFTREGKIEIIASRGGAGQITLTVHDTGIGIDENELGKIFDDFYQGNRTAAKPGSGLGLAITRRLVALLEGEITVTSKPGAGAAFSVTLPLAIESRETTVEMPLSDPERTALIIGKDAAMLYLTRKYLSEAGYSVATTNNLTQGLELARLAKPALIAIDLDAIENHADAVNQLASHKEQGRLIAFSANPTLQPRAINSGADAFLPKPVERAALLASLQSTLAPAEPFILVVDDDADALEILTLMLETSGYRVKTATNGREALESVAQARPALLLLDLMMPEMDGFEVAHRLRVNPNWGDIPVLLTTARDLTNEERAALENGGTHILQKGFFNRQELLSEVDRLLKG